MKRNKLILTVSILFLIITALILIAAGDFLKSNAENRHGNGNKGTGIAFSVNGENVSIEEVRDAYSAMKNKGLPDEEALEKALDSLINYKLILQDARKSNIKASREEVEQALEGIATASGTTREEIVKRAEERGVSEEELMKKMEEEIIIRKAAAKALAERQWENSGSKKNNGTAYVLVRQIYLPSKKYSSIELLEMANNISDRLKNGEKFCSIAEEYMQNCTEYLVGRGTTFKEYEDAAFMQGEGNTSIITSPAGVHFVQTVAKTSGLSSAESPAVELTEDERSRAYTDYIRKLRRDAEIKIFLQKNIFFLT